MPANSTAPAGFVNLALRLVRVGIGAVRNRGELLITEWQEEKIRLTELLVWTVGMLVAGTMSLGLITAVVIFVFPAQYRLYVAAGMALVYIVGTLAAAASVRSLLRKEPFAESIAQARKDVVWLESSR